MNPKNHWALAAAWALALLLVAGCSDDSNGPQPDSTVDAAPDEGVPDAGVDSQTDSATDGGEQAKQLVILHTNDIHAALWGWAPNRDFTPDTTGDDTTVGGISRLATLIDAERAAAGSTPVLLLDAGDFMMGSMFDWLSASKAAILGLMDQLGYDATTLGNHEFDWTTKALALCLDAAVKAGVKVPFVASNMVFDSTDPGDDELEQLVTAGVIKKKLVKTLPNGLKVGLFGVLGKAAEDVSFGHPPLSFEDAAAAAKPIIQELRDVDKVDLVIALAHSGIEDDGTGDSADLAKDAPGIDVIISGHTHTAIATEIKVDNTIIVEAGAHGSHLGKLELKVENGAVTLEKYTLLDVGDQTKGDATVQASVDGYVNDIDAMLTAAGSPLTCKTDVAETTFDLTFPKMQETILGNVITDAYRAAVTALDPGDPVTVAVDSGGVIADPVLKGASGKLWTMDLYRALPKGIGPDGKVGYPLVSFYLNGKDLKSGMELLPLSKEMLNTNDYFMQLSGIAVEFTASGLPFNRVTSITTLGTTPTPIDLTDTTTCYKVVTSLLVGEQLSLVSSFTSGLLKVEPKEKDCSTLITDMKARIVDRDPATAGVQELKHWQAFFSFVSQFPDTNGNQLPDIPQAYSQLQDRIVFK